MRAITSPAKVRVIICVKEHTQDVAKAIAARLRECPNLQNDMNRLDRHIATEALSAARAQLPLISVVIQTPANVDQVRSAVSCLKKQTYSVWEAIFLVDANNAPAILHAAQAEARAESRVRCISTGSEAACEIGQNLLKRAAAGLFCCMNPARPFDASHLELLLQNVVQFDPVGPDATRGVNPDAAELKSAENNLHLPANHPPPAEIVAEPAKHRLRLGLILATRLDKGYLHTFGPSGLGYLAASVRRHLPGVEVVMKEKLEDLLALKPDLIGISAQSENYAVAIQFGKQIKQTLNIPVIIGGVHITMLSESLHDTFDVGVMGEGETTLVELLQSFMDHRGFDREALKSISGLVFKHHGSLHRTAPRELVKDLDSLAPPVFEELPFHRKSHMVCLMSARGCPYHCTFCISEKFSQRYRSLSFDRVADDVENWVKVKGVKHIVFYDDLLIANKKRVEGLLARLRQKKLLGKCTFSCAVRANLIDDEMCRLLKELGVLDLGIGLESFSDKILRYYNKSGCTGEINQRAIDLLYQAGIKVNPCIILAAPIETKEDMLVTLRKVYENLRDGKINGPTWSTLIPYPGTKVWDYALARGIVSLDMDWDKFSTAHSSLYLCEAVSQAEFGELITEWMTKISILLRNQPERGGTFVIRNPQVVAQNALRLEPKIRDRKITELGDDLILGFTNNMELPIPDSPAEIRRQAADLCHSGKWDKVEPFFRKLTSLQPNELDGWEGRIACARKLNHRVLEQLIRNEALIQHPEWKSSFLGNAEN